MSTPSPVLPPHPPTPPRRPSNMTDWLPSRRALLWMLLAFVAGLVVFALVWSNGDSDFYRAGPTKPISGPDYEPLPTPLPAGERDASGLVRPPADELDEERPQLVEVPRPPPPPAAQAAPAVPRETAAASTRPEPIAGSAPIPRYPARALRRGERGVVVVRAEVGPDGVPTSVSLSESSGSRLLDRAALDAVRNWRFHPARADGQPTTGTVRVPIEFSPD